MILVDANILLYAEDQSSSFNVKARKWWDAQLSGESPIFYFFQEMTTNPSRLAARAKL